MPRRRRYQPVGMPLHIVQRGVNRQPVFFQEDDYRAYSRWLGRAAMHYGVSVHAYCLMTNHVHLLLTPSKDGVVSQIFEFLGRHYVRYINRRYRRTGTLWEGRYRAALVDADQYLLRCYRYIELNPVRARMTANPLDYPWSSCRHNAGGYYDSLVTPHVTYDALANNIDKRIDAYREMLGVEVAADELSEIRAATARNSVLGSTGFRATLESRLGHPLGPKRPGHPRGEFGS